MGCPIRQRPAEQSGPMGTEEEDRWYGQVSGRREFGGDPQDGQASGLF